LNSLACN